MFIPWHVIPPHLVQGFWKAFMCSPILPLWYNVCGTPALPCSCRSPGRYQLAAACVLLMLSTASATPCTSGEHRGQHRRHKQRATPPLSCSICPDSRVPHGHPADTESSLVLLSPLQALSGGGARCGAPCQEPRGSLPRQLLPALPCRLLPQVQVGGAKIASCLSALVLLYCNNSNMLLWSASLHEWQAVGPFQTRPLCYLSNGYSVKSVLLYQVAGTSVILFSFPVLNLPCSGASTTALSPPFSPCRRPVASQPTRQAGSCCTLRVRPPVH